MMMMMMVVVMMVVVVVMMMMMMMTTMMIISPFKRGFIVSLFILPTTYPEVCIGKFFIYDT